MEDVEALTAREGKGNKERVTYLPSWARKAVEACLLVRSTTLGSKPLPLPINKAGRIEGPRLSSQAVLDILVRVGESASVDGFALHDMRRTFITSLLDAGVGLHVVSQLARHASVETTKLHNQRGEQAQMRAGETAGAG